MIAYATIGMEQLIIDQGINFGAVNMKRSHNKI